MKTLHQSYNDGMINPEVVDLVIEGWQTTSGLTIPSLYDRCSVFVKRGMLLTVHVQVDLAKRRRERTGSYPDGRGNGRSAQLVRSQTQMLEGTRVTLHTLSYTHK
jgi:hypothetical protein